MPGGRPITILILALLSTFVYVFYKVSAPQVAWFWTSLFSGGALSLFVFSPEHKILAGLRMVRPYEWPLMMAPFVFVLLIGPNQYTLNVNIEVRIISCICGTASMVGYSVFWRRVMVGIVWKRIRGMLGFKPYNQGQ